jgi:hypothetical protein
MRAFARSGIPCERKLDKMKAMNEQFQDMSEMKETDAVMK